MHYNLKTPTATVWTPNVRAAAVQQHSHRVQVDEDGGTRSYRHVSPYIIPVVSKIYIFQGIMSKLEIQCRDNTSSYHL